MEQLIQQVSGLVQEEYGRAGAKFGLKNKSDHESYAVCKEEFEEAQEDLDIMKRYLEDFWRATKNNESADIKLGISKKLMNYSILAACECIQVAAMASKAAITVCDYPAFQELFGKEGEDG